MVLSQDGCQPKKRERGNSSDHNNKFGTLSDGANKSAFSDTYSNPDLDEIIFNKNTSQGGGNATSPSGGGFF